MSSLKSSNIFSPFLMWVNPYWLIPFSHMFMTHISLVLSYPNLNARAKFSLAYCCPEQDGLPAWEALPSLASV
tara:strand:- start:11 stop:229 length:219 start_codon:yes stop_codon:yes gene_type:complete